MASLSYTKEDQYANLYLCTLSKYFIMSPLQNASDATLECHVMWMGGKQVSSGFDIKNETSITCSEIK